MKLTEYIKLTECVICGEKKAVKDEHGLLTTAFEFENVCQECIESIEEEPEEHPEQSEGTGKDCQNINFPF